MKPSLFQRIFPGNPVEAPARHLYEAIVLQARCPEFYTDCAVPDSVDGRFELLVLHCILVMRRLRRDGEATVELSQTLFDTLIYDLDQSLRVSGVGDLKVGPKLKTMGEAFYGRFKAYDEALEAESDAELQAALQRNLYGTVPPPPMVALAAMATYMRKETRALEAQDSADLMGGTVRFGTPPKA